MVIADFLHASRLPGNLLTHCEGWSRRRRSLNSAPLVANQYTSQPWLVRFLRFEFKESRVIWGQGL